jgi:hypothetical protein
VLVSRTKRKGLNEGLTCGPDHSGATGGETPSDLLQCSEFDFVAVKGRIELRVTVSICEFTG